MKLVLGAAVVATMTFMSFAATTKALANDCKKVPKDWNECMSLSCPTFSTAPGTKAREARCTRFKK
jgi:hypothetical protein